MKNPTVIFRISNACNLDCTYCYDKNNHKHINKENENILNNMDIIINNLSKLCYNKDTVSKIIFHGGEPLIINADIYEMLIQRILKEIPNVKFSIQTNGTLMTQKHMEIFKKYNVKIGISLDGYNEEMNCCRIYSDGTNSFNTVMKKIRQLKEENIDYGIIMTLSNGILGHEKELYKFISENKIRCNIRPAFSCGSEDYTVMNSKQYFEFFRNIFDIWIEDKEGIELTQIREIYEQFAKVLKPNCRIGDCATSGNCFLNFISLDVEGNLYSCNRTYNNKNFYYGNINQISIENLMEKMNSLQKRRRSYILSSHCKECEIFEECNGGCPANAFSCCNTIQGVDNFLCDAKIQIRHYVKNKLEDLGYIEEYNNKLREGKKDE